MRGYAMDPKVTLADWLGGIGSRRDNASNYNDWIARGGFPARIALAPFTDAFMKGDRYATVVDIGIGSVKVVYERSGKVRWVSRSKIARVMA